MTNSMFLLACDVARYHFGSVVGEVVHILITHPSSGLDALATRIEPFYSSALINAAVSQHSKKRQECRQLVSNALAVLLQHEMAIVHETYVPVKKDIPQGTEAPLETKLTYDVNVDNILCRIRIPLYLGFARRRFGSIGESAFRAIFERGRLTAAMLFQAAIDETMNKLSLTDVEAEACLVDMAHSGLLHWTCMRHVSRSGKKAGNADVKVGQKRPRSPPPSDDDDDDDSDSDDDSDDDAQMNTEVDGVGVVDQDGKIFVGRGNSRRKVGAPTRSNDTDVWTVSYWHLNREFRNDCCVKVLHSRLNNEMASHIMRAGLQLALDREDCHYPSEDFETGDISTDAIQKQLERLNVNGMSNFWEAVQVLVNEVPRVVVPIPENAPTMLRFIPGQLIADVRQKTIDDFIRQRYLNIGRRVFNALALEGGMDENMLAKKCMMPMKMVRERVNKMYEDRLVYVQEVPRSHEQQRSANWIYLWAVNMPAVTRQVQDVMYTVTRNLFNKLQSVDVKGAQSEVDKKRAAGYETFLTGEILRMDQSIMVMRDFGEPTAVYFPAKYTVTDGFIGKVKKKR